MTIKKAQEWGISELKKNKVDQLESSANFLLRRVLDVNKAYLVSCFDRKLNLIQEKKFRKWIQRRSKYEPVWYISGRVEFFGQDFYVNKNVLIPRPETELMVEKVLKQIQNQKNKKQKGFKILDMGTGSGAIILSLIKKLEDYSSRKQNESRSLKRSHLSSNNSYYASDISSEALVVAKKNAKNLGLYSKIKFKKGNLFASWLGQKFDLIVANLPYIPHEEMSEA
jgi:release factor glutamine methyltransferase